MADLYFAEKETESNRLVMRCGLAGPFVKNGTVVLTASRTDWSLFNRRAEEGKVGAVICYEKLVKPEGAALVARKSGATKHAEVAKNSAASRYEKAACAF